MGGLIDNGNVVVTDFNTFVKQGLFFINGDGKDNNTQVFVQALNAPVNGYKWGILIVLSCNGLILQKYHPITYGSNNLFYIRMKSDTGTWTLWKSVATTNA